MQWDKFQELAASEAEQNVRSYFNLTYTSVQFLRGGVIIKRNVCELYKYIWQISVFYGYK
jgi:hypothetical protein